ncbi:MAG TPA: carbohydrate kinase family protein [Pyrinomonadaceae bacterium]|nr:carbohydrate kinase family protein [Pyrinomonadaceae bacterium]
MSRLERPKILVIGELNVDIVASGLSSLPEMGAEILAEDCELTLGSASAIVAVGMAKLGHNVTFVSQVGRDYFGDFCIRALQQLGVSTRHVARKADEKTGVTIALSGKRDRALVTHCGAVATLTSDRIDEALMKRHKHLHLTSYYLQKGLKPSFADIFRRAKALGLTTSFDPNSDPSNKWSKSIDGVLRYTDVLFVNEREASQLTRSSTPKTALKALGTKVPCAAIKRGPRGAMAIQDGAIAIDSGFKVTAVDTTGAGDSFDAGFLSAYLRNAPLAECVRIGNACGALSATRVGGTAGQPTEPELQAFLRSNAAKRSK